jgi:ubiquinol-cytochrome c reductase cytochrome c1 subunit
MRERAGLLVKRGLSRAAVITLLALGSACAGVASVAFAAEETTAPVPGAPALTGGDWEHWKPGNEVKDTASLQRGARNFLAYCVGCHSLKYMRYARMAQDLHITNNQLLTDLILPGAKATDYIITPMPASDSATWFGKTPPDLSLEARLRGTAWIYQYLETFYSDPSRSTTGVNNLRLENSAMPHVLASLQGVPVAVFRTVGNQREFVGFQPGTVAGSLTPQQYDDFVRDLVNFLDYVGEPAQVARRQLGIWVVLFLLAFTAIAWFLKKEYWKDVH